MAKYKLKYLHFIMHPKCTRNI